MALSSPFYIAAGPLLSPGDFFDYVPYVRVSDPLRVARKPSYSLPKTYKITGELREILDPEKHAIHPPLNFEAPGEEILVAGKKSRAIFLTWGSEVEDDERRGNLHKKDWLIAPVFPLRELENVLVPSDGTEKKILITDAIRERKSARFFPLAAFPGAAAEDQVGYYVDFRKISTLAASHLHGVNRQWHLGTQAFDNFYHHLIWFFTRKRVFLGPIACTKCGEQVDLGITFEGQALEPE